MTRNAWIAILVGAAWMLPAAASDSDARGPLSSNVLVTFTVRQGHDAAEESYRLLARGDGSNARLVTGWRVPIPTAPPDPDESSGSAAAYSYQHVGMTANLSANAISEDRVVLRGEIEISGAENASRDRTRAPVVPTIGTFQQTFNVLLEEGRPIHLAAVADSAGGAVTVGLQADILD